MRLPLGIVLVLLVGCDRPETDPPKSSDPKSEPKSEPKPESEPKPQPTATATACMPAGLEAATELAPWRLPSGCSVTSGSLSAPTIVRSADELAGAITCEPGVKLPSVDFTAQQVNVASFSLSPAYGGSVVVDDGKTVTFVQRDRSPCPDDPLPMPIDSSLAYLLPSGAERNYAQASCSLPPRCD